MVSRFDNLSIRSKLVLIVAGAVVTLTLAVLGVVWWNARQQVNQDIAEELRDSKDAFMVLEAENLQQQVEQTSSIASLNDVRELLKSQNANGGCEFLKRFLAGDRAAAGEQTFDVASLRLADGHPLVTAHAGRCQTGSARRSWKPVPSAPGLTNWESAQGAMFLATTAPVMEGSKLIGAFLLGREVNQRLAQHVKEHTQKDAFYWHVDGGVPHLIASSNPAFNGSIESELKTKGGAEEFQIEVKGAEYSVLDATTPPVTDAQHNPEGLRLAVVQSVSGKLEPFRRLELVLAALAACTILLSVTVGVFLAQPIASPLIVLAGAASSVADGKLHEVDDLLARYPERLQARDEVGTLGRAFVHMVKGLKERLAMSAFLSDTAHELIKHNPDAAPETSRQNMVLLFSDIRQFSAFAESRDPQVVIDTLNRVLGLQAEIMRKHGGDVDKFVGDAVIAWFSGPGRCTRAVAAAEESIRALIDEFRQAPATIVGFGVHAGEVVMGCVGSAQRREYTAIGSTVNLAARLCAAAAGYQILISQQVADELSGARALRALEPIRFKGFSEPLPVYEVVRAQAAGG